MDYGPKIDRNDERTRRLELKYARDISDILQQLDNGEISLPDAATDRFRKACEYATIYENDELSLDEDFSGVPPRKLDFCSDFIKHLYSLEGGEFKERERQFKREIRELEEKEDSLPHYSTSSQAYGKWFLGEDDIFRT